MNFWLSPSGRVVDCGLGEHTTKVIDLLFEKYADEAVKAGVINQWGCLTDGNSDPVGFLERKGWIRYQYWTKTPGWLINGRRPTKKQIERMFELTGYYHES